jgi:hypothetical protein
MTHQSRTWLAAVFALACWSGVATAQGPGPWSDDFESYPLGSIVGMGGWEEWDLAVHVNPGTVVSTPIPAHSGVQYLDCRNDGDTVQEYTGYTSGAYEYKAWIYLPGPTSATPLAHPAWFILLNTYNVGGAKSWSAELQFKVNGTVTGDAGAFQNVSMPYTFDKWIEIRVCIDLTNDKARYFIDGVPLGGIWSWKNTIFGGGGGVLDIAAVDLYANGTSAPGSPFWFDTLSLSATATTPAIYCTAKVSSGGCTPAISSSGSPSASSGSGFVISASQVEPDKFGVFFYGKTGKAALPFSGGTLCVEAPFIRVATLNSGGFGPCSGTYGVNFNAWIAGGSDPALVECQNVFAQYWFRDPGFAPPNNSGLTDAIEFVINP